ncbi:hypothetical protein JCM3774_006529 [Rhodotorula dairenensis]
MLISDLPVELLKQCLDYVRLPSSSERLEVARDEQSLPSCCLVSRQWRVLAQPMLFERAQLVLEPAVEQENGGPIESGFRSIACFSRTCQARPDLAACTKRLHFVEPTQHKGRARVLDPCVPTLLQGLPSLRDLLVSARVPFDLAWLDSVPVLEAFNAWAVDFHSSGRVVLPTLRLFSTCGATFPTNVHDFFSPRSLPAVKVVAHLFGRSGPVDLSNLAASVRVVANSNLRGPGENIADTTLYMVRYDTILPDHGRDGTLGDCLATDEVHHLCLVDVFTSDPASELLHALTHEPSLAHLRTLCLEVTTLSASGELADLIKRRRIKVTEFNAWSDPSVTGPVIPPEWSSLSDNHTRGQ